LGTFFSDESESDGDAHSDLDSTFQPSDQSSHSTSESHSECTESFTIEKARRPVVNLSNFEDAQDKKQRRFADNKWKAEQQKIQLELKALRSKLHSSERSTFSDSTSGRNDDEVNHEENHDEVLDENERADHDIATVLSIVITNLCFLFIITYLN